MLFSPETSAADGGAPKQWTRPVHGGLDDQELAALGIERSEVIDFSANVNPLGPSPLALRALKKIDLAAYPDPHCRALRNALSERLQVPAEAILMGNGSIELIYALTRALLEPNGRCLIFGPTFGEYARAARLSDASVVEVTASVESGFRWKRDDVQRDGPEPKLVFLCNPNNPTGIYLGQDEVVSRMEPLDQGVLVLDEAFISFVDNPWSALDMVKSSRVILLRSMTKDLGLAGLRLGYLIADPPLVGRISPFLPTWSVNAAAQAAGLAALSDEAHLERTRAVLRHGKAYLMDSLRTLGLTPLPSEANFLLLETGRAAEVRRKLLMRGICVRDCSSFGLPRHIRISVRSEPDCRRLIAALREVLDDG